MIAAACWAIKTIRTWDTWAGTELDRLLGREILPRVSSNDKRQCQRSRWRGDGPGTYYRSRDGALLAVEIVTNPAFQAGNSQPSECRPLRCWDSTADGRRFLTLANQSGPQLYTVVLNWQAGLKK